MTYHLQLLWKKMLPFLNQSTQSWRKFRQEARAPNTKWPDTRATSCIEAFMIPCAHTAPQAYIIYAYNIYTYVYNTDNRKIATCKFWPTIAGEPSLRSWQSKCQDGDEIELLAHRRTLVVVISESRYSQRTIGGYYTPKREGDRLACRS